MTSTSSDNAVIISGENGHGKHHCEVLIMNRDPEGPGGSGDYYNSLGIDDDVPDDEFDARFRALDPEQLKEQFGGDGIRFNGPRRWLTDRFTVKAIDGGEPTDVGGIPMHLLGNFVAPDFDAFLAGKQAPYQETPSRRTTTYWFDAGREVYELVSPEGKVFVMQSASLRIDPNNTVDRLSTLGDRLSLAPGWEFRVRTLEEELVVPVTFEDDPPNTIVLDELENNYQVLRNP